MGTKISALGALTAPAGGDLFPIVDISDTTQGAGGSTKKMTLDVLQAAPVTANALGALAIDTSKRLNTKTISADSTFTFSGAPPAGTFFSLKVHNSDFDFAKTITFPASHSIARNKNVTTCTVPANIVTVNGDIILTWYYDGSDYYLLGDFNGQILATGQWTTLYGYDAGASATGADFSVFVGYEAGKTSPSPGQAVGVGYQAGLNPGGYAGTFVGYTAGKNGGGTSAVGIGYAALASADNTGTGNVAIGVHAAEVITTMSGTIVLGYHALNGATTSSNSVIIGDHAAAVANASNCIFLGPYSGVSRHNTLWIEGEGTSIGSHIPLIYGQFDNDAATVNGSLRVGTPAANTVAIASAALEVVSTSKAAYLPRMTKAQRDAISSPAAGAMVYQTDNTPGLRTYNGTNWMRYTETAD